ncbi:hypothetical protein V6617_18335 (plasmid) [Pelagibacterium nitratireducens]|jgi:hypothetical protein|uniref:Uncharacterized protein n=2 Tax=Devosiaceae TaxID=2831106 RepID=A0A918S1P0_9HYPH|nr:hypothetical protein [Devosia pacifica]MBN15411.1 hypothetical protein [Pelagibacterium sp.]GHA19475.1 hypothetical protein GCM10007989_13810 [Devosia pacifica]|tara:strand:- start:145 stop:483 length:339 start_codon:yes stop_codon:yes gene_type:complete
MKFFVRLIVVTVLAAFAASSVAHATGSAEMTAAMIASDDAAMDMPDCDACGDEGQTAFACDVICGAGGFASLLVPQSQGMFQSPRQTLNPVVTQNLRGLTGPPAKQPPRSLI